MTNYLICHYHMLDAFHWDRVHFGYSIMLELEVVVSDELGVSKGSLYIPSLFLLN
jgi:hypothetical protein